MLLLKGCARFRVDCIVHVGPTKSLYSVDWMYIESQLESFLKTPLFPQMTASLATMLYYQPDTEDQFDPSVGGALGSVPFPLEDGTMVLFLPSFGIFHFCCESVEDLAWLPSCPAAFLSFSYSLGLPFPLLLILMR